MGRDMNGGEGEERKGSNLP